jgi:hypothetical protein
MPRFTSRHLLPAMAVVILAAVWLAAPAAAQTVPTPTRSVELSGPRFGVTVLSDGVVAKLRDKDIDVSPAISQFGWQFERQLYHSASSVSVVTEWVGLLGGLDQGYAIPSLSWLVGLRTRKGAEFGLGPNITPGGTALVLAAGHTFRSGIMNVPVNVAVIPSRNGFRFTVLTGFSLR